MTPPKGPHLFLGLATALTFDASGHMADARECDYNGYHRVAAEMTPHSLSGDRPRIVNFVASNTEPFDVPSVVLNDAPLLWWVLYDRREVGTGNLLLAVLVNEATWVAAQGRINPGFVRFGVDDRPQTVETLTPRPASTTTDDEADDDDTQTGVTFVPVTKATIVDALTYRDPSLGVMGREELLRRLDLILRTLREEPKRGIAFNSLQGALIRVAQSLDDEAIVAKLRELIDLTMRV